MMTLNKDDIVTLRMLISIAKNGIGNDETKLKENIITKIEDKINQHETQKHNKSIATVSWY
jgi:hypothetical protein